MGKKKVTYEEMCPSCGNIIEVPAAVGEIRKCTFCRRRYLVKEMVKHHKILEEHAKEPNKNTLKK